MEQTQENPFKAPMANISQTHVVEMVFNVSGPPLQTIATGAMTKKMARLKMAR